MHSLASGANGATVTAGATVTNPTSLHQPLIKKKKERILLLLSTHTLVQMVQL
jgi:hypothetical protein